MRRVVVTGMGIVSSIGNNTQEVLASLHEAKPGITHSEDYARLGFRSQVFGRPTLNPADVVDQRSPFEPGISALANAPNAIRPDQNRPREFLEQFSLDTLRMVGTVKLKGKLFGLVQTKDGLVHRVLPGNHLGQSDGRITAIEEGKISLTEIVPDGMGGFIERPAALALSE